LNLTIRLFASLKDLVGASTIKIHVPVSASVETLLSTLIQEYPVLEASLNTVIVAVNQKYTDPDQTLYIDDEIMLFPPVSGG